MTEYKYIVWVGGSVIGEYFDEFDAEQVASEYRKDGYDDAVSVEIEEDDLILMSPNRKRITQLEAEKEAVYEMMVGVGSYTNVEDRSKHYHDEIMERIKDLYEADSLLTYLSSDEYIDLINRREEYED